MPACLVVASYQGSGNGQILGRIAACRCGLKTMTNLAWIAVGQPGDFPQACEIQFMLFGLRLPETKSNAGKAEQEPKSIQA
jgi:hypothetical protein